MRNKATLVALLLLGTLGCAGHPATPELSDGGCHAECMVCKHNADLACVDVAVNDQTPRNVYQGKAYYFCSPECRDEFARDPVKYTGN